jgi:hypothetical protein
MKDSRLNSIEHGLRLNSLDSQLVSQRAAVVDLHQPFHEKKKNYRKLDVDHHNHIHAYRQRENDKDIELPTNTSSKTNFPELIISVVFSPTMSGKETGNHTQRCFLKPKRACPCLMGLDIFPG